MTMAMLKAIIIDQNASSRGLLQTVLTNNGWEVAGHTNTNNKGLMMMKQHQPQFVCIDMQNASEEGGLVETIRRDWPKSLIFLTASAIDRDAAEKAVASGVHGFFIKPYNQATVAATVRNAVLRLVKSQQESL